MPAPSSENTSKQPLTPIQRRAEIAKMVRLRNTTLLKVLRSDFQCSQNHLYQILDNHRRPSRELAERVAKFVGIPVREFWGRTDFNEVNGRAR
jgi:hypothetical protein